MKSERIVPSEEGRQKIKTFSIQARIRFPDGHVRSNIKMTCTAFENIRL
jgi:hypothetical protein